MSERWKNTKEYTAEQSEIVQEQTQKAANNTLLKNGKTPRCCSRANNGNVPIERAELSSTLIKLIRLNKVYRKINENNDSYAF